MPSSKQVVAVFDFDDTIIRGSSLTDFLRCSFGRFKRLWRYASVVPSYTRFRLHQITLSAAKEKLLTSFLAGMSLKEFGQMCGSYVSRLDRLVVPEAMERIIWHQQHHHVVIIASASLEDLLSPWAKRYGIDDVLATRLEVINGVITGRLAGPNCSGPEKVNRLLEIFPVRKDYELFVYGDGATDTELLHFADHANLRAFS